jgi:hypothetical protein
MDPPIQAECSAEYSEEELQRGLSIISEELDRRQSMLRAWIAPDRGSRQ